MTTLLEAIRAVKVHRTGQNLPSTRPERPRTTSLPKTIKVGAITFEICEIERLTDKENSRTLWGNVRNDECRVLIEAQISEQQKRKTLLHEICHLILEHSGRFEQASDEGLIEALSDGMMGVLIDNPGLSAYLAGGGDA